MTESSKIDFRRYPDLASRALGGSVMVTNDDFFADVQALLAAGPPRHDPLAFGPRGKIYDGWETRRGRGTGDDFAIVRLAVPGVVRGVNIDTTHFKGNYPPFASVQATTLLGYPTADEVQAADWTTLVDHTDLDGDSPNVAATTGPERLVTHLRLTIHPDGGVARFRAFGDVVPDPRRLGGRVDLAALTSGGLIDDCSNMFFASPANMLSPGRAQVMSDGWETRRRRDDGHDWATVTLAVPGDLHEVVVDTTRFIGNAPAECRLTDVGSGTELLPVTRLLPDTEHRFRLVPADAPVRAVRLDIYPDGGISRLRVLGTVPEDLQDEIARRWLGLLPEGVADTVDHTEFFA